MNRQQEILRHRKDLHTLLALLGAYLRSCIDNVKFQGVYNQLVWLPWLNADEEQTSAHHFSSSVEVSELQSLTLDYVHWSN